MCTLNSILKFTTSQYVSPFFLKKMSKLPFENLSIFFHMQYVYPPVVFVWYWRTGRLGSKSGFFYANLYILFEGSTVSLDHNFDLVNWYGFYIL